jgi:hypothetical protein
VRKKAKKRAVRVCMYRLNMTYTLGVPSLNLSEDSNYPEVLCDFPQSSWINAEIVSCIRPILLPSSHLLTLFFDHYIVWM